MAAMMKLDVISALVRLLQSSSTTTPPETRAIAAWALGNIAGDSVATRDKVLQAGALSPMLQLAALAAKASKTARRFVETARGVAWFVASSHLHCVCMCS